jgi:hypothetical protein
MSYIVIVANGVYEEDFMPTYKFFETLEEAQAYKKSIDDEGDWFTYVEIYEAKRVA